MISDRYGRTKSSMQVSLVSIHSQSSYDRSERNRRMGGTNPYIEKGGI